jgi:hypothetical protein
MCTRPGQTPEKQKSDEAAAPWAVQQTGFDPATSAAAAAAAPTTATAPTRRRRARRGEGRGVGGVVGDWHRRGGRRAAARGQSRKQCGAAAAGAAQQQQLGRRARLPEGKGYTSNDTGPAMKPHHVRAATLSVAPAQRWSRTPGFVGVRAGSPRRPRRRAPTSR